MQATFNAYLFNPVFWYVRRYLRNPKIRKILVRGGSSAGKTFSICDALNLYQLERVYNVFALRKHRVHVETTIKASFETSIKRLGPLVPYYTMMEGEIRVATGSETHYAGMDDPEKVKGLEGFHLVYVNEFNQFEPAEWEELNRRMRGRPDQKLVADWNPISSTHWINTELLNDDEWIDEPTRLPEEEEAFGAFTRLDEEHSFVKINAAGDTVWINVTYRDNFWVVGHPGNTEPAEPGAPAFRNGDPKEPITLEPGMFVAPDGNLYGFRDIHTLANFERMKAKKPNDYRIYGLGMDGLMRTGNEFWYAFTDRHVRAVEYDPALPLHITVDNNRYPYVTISCWQVKGREIRQVWEIPARAPHNTAAKAALLLNKWLQKVGNELALNIYGDPSANNESTVDDDGRSFFDKFLDILERCDWKIFNHVGRSAPSVALSAEFINDIYEEETPALQGWKIVVNIACKTSVEDYTLVKKDPNGKMSKEKVPDPADPAGKRKIEKYGHFSDAKRYFLVTLLADLYLTYKNRKRLPRAQAVQE